MLMTQVDFPSILDSLNDGLYLVDNNRRITYWNKAAERITGFKSEEVVGRCCSDNLLIHVDTAGCDLCAGNCPLAATIHDQTSHEASIFLHHKNGHRIPVFVRVIPLQNDQGEIVGLFSNTTLPLLADIAHRLCMLVRKSRIDTGEQPVSLTISVGGTTPVEKDTLEDLLQRADRLMYHSKDAGRDRATLG